MAWYGANGVWTKRAAITVSPVASPADVDVVVPALFDSFWTDIDASGNEARVADVQGNTVDWDWSGFNKTNRTGTLKLNNVNQLGSDRAICLFLYYASTSNQGDFGGTAGTGSANGYIELARPSGPYVVRHQPAIPGATTPLKTFSKTAGETADLWIYYGGVPSGAWTPANTTTLRDEVHYIIQTVEDNAGADQSGMYDKTRMRFVWIPRQGTWVRVQVKSGTSGSVYTSSVRAATVDDHDQLTPRAVVDTRVGWRVRDVRLT